MVDFDQEFFDKRFKSDKMILAADELCLHHFDGPENVTEPRPSNLDLRTAQFLFQKSGNCSLLLFVWEIADAFIKVSRPVPGE